MATKTCENDSDFYGLAITPNTIFCVSFLYKIGDTASNDIPTIAENMTKSFYKQMSDYDFTAHKPKTGKEYKDTNQFTAMVWKGAGAPATDFAAFAIQNGCAAARFCAATAKPNFPLTVDGYKPMVKPRCIDDNGVNTCFAEKLLKSINKQRLLRATTDPVKADSAGDKAIAQAIKDISATLVPTTVPLYTDFVTKLKEQKDILSKYKTC
jgi:hypothetical protein